ncbi:cytochrome P450 4C1-like [Cylas formicarius]|uniref:cytochrome P450 4C1-like n=1 Tax=Cylas formicarius TaxID=197179 RepID=UPI002958788C|nr:cytochrome P450 4C1-like [Cylas formicarius]
MSLIVYLVLLYVFWFLTGHSFRSFADGIRRRRVNNKLPVPEGWIPILGNGLQLLGNPDNVFKVLRKWAQQYYPIYAVHLGPKIVVCVFGPDEVEAVISTTKHNTKADVYRFLNLWLGTGLLTSAGLKWQRRRKILTPTFHFNILKLFVNIFNNEADGLVKTILQNPEERVINIAPLISDLTLGAINETAMGVNLGTFREQGLRYKEAVYEISTIVYKRFVRFWNGIDFFYHNFSSLAKTERSVVTILHNFTNNIIKKREETFKAFNVPLDIEENAYAVNTDRHHAMLDVLLNAKLNDGIIDDAGISEEVNTFVFEGHDTTAMSLIFTLLLLANHKDIQDRIYEEIVESLNNNLDKEPSYNDLQDMKYTERCIKESLRLYPSVPFIGRVLEEDVFTSRGKIAKGTTVFIHVYDLHRTSSLWSDPEKFNPDRFLAENSSNRHPFAYIPFSAGPRNCIGQRFAILEIKSALCALLKKFKLEPVDRPEDIVYIQDLVLRPKNGVRMKFIRR